MLRAPTIYDGPRMIELDSRYCDVIVRRWQNWTEREAVLESDGRTFAAVAVDAGRTDSSTEHARILV